MNQPTSSNTALILGGFLSALLHLAGGVAVVWWMDQAPAGAAAAVPEPETEADKPDLVLGLEQSRNVTINWIGFEQATEHLAEQADVEQPELTTDPTGGGASATAPAAAHVPEPLILEPPLPPLPPPPVPARTTTVATPAGITEPGADPPPTEATTPTVAVQPTPAEATPEAREPSTTPAELAPPPLPPIEVEVPTPAERPNEQGAPGQKGEGRGDAPGEAAEKESSATALTKTLEVRPGRPAAAEGLEINTIRPRWRNMTLLTARPRNPTVWITFGRDGKVKRAGFVTEKKKVLNTGYPEVDEPLLNAIYRWTAKGPALADIPASPEGTPVAEEPGITVRIRIVLIG